MARRQPRWALLGLWPLLACAPAAPTAPAPVPELPPFLAVPELGLQIERPADARDLVYVMGLAPEGQPAAYFSTGTLASLGGPACRAGATAAVSPYPLGRVVLAQETPVEVALETAVNPAESLGEPIGRVTAGHLYYAPPPVEPCAPEVPSAAELQARQVVALRAALRDATALR